MKDESVKSVDIVVAQMEIWCARQGGSLCNAVAAGIHGVRVGGLAGVQSANVVDCCIVRPPHGQECLSLAEP